MPRGLPGCTRGLIPNLSRTPGSDHEVGTAQGTQEQWLTVSDQTAGTILQRLGMPPAPAHTTPPWHAVLWRHRSALWATDCCAGAVEQGSGLGRSAGLVGLSGGHRTVQRAGMRASCREPIQPRD